MPDQIPKHWSAQDIAAAKSNARYTGHAITCECNRPGGRAGRCDCGLIAGQVEVVVPVQTLLSLGNLLQEFTVDLDGTDAHQARLGNEAYALLLTLPAEVRHAMEPPLFTGIEREEQHLAEATARRDDDTVILPRTPRPQGRTHR